MKVKFQVNDEEHKKWILSNMGEKWEENRSWLYHEYYDPSLDLEENIHWGPDSIPKDQWISLLTVRRHLCESSLIIVTIYFVTLLP